MRIRYEDLVSMPQKTIQSVLDFCDLDVTPQVLAALSGVTTKTKEHHEISSCKSQEILDTLISLAHRHGYQDTEGTFAINM
jgi:hypothetical protein